MQMLSEVQYLPSIQFFVHIMDHDSVLIEAQEHFQKQTFRNRCRILGSNKVQELSIPVKKKGHNIPIKEVEIDYNQKWQQVHWRAISSAYGNAPFFEFYSDYFEGIFLKKHKFLFDLDIELLLLCLKLLRIRKEVRFTEKFDKVTSSSDSGINDLRNTIYPGRDLEKDDNITFKKYNQVFGKEFVKNLSIIDLLFCEGNNALHILQKPNFLI